MQGLLLQVVWVCITDKTSIGALMYSRALGDIGNVGGVTTRSQAAKEKVSAAKVAASRPLSRLSGD